jgi:hypoxanthine phosphoribosyltransferase
MSTSSASTIDRLRNVHGDIDRILIDRNRIAQRISALAAEIRRDWADWNLDDEIVLIPVLTGAMIFVADLMRHLPHKFRINVVSASSYQGRSTKSAGEPAVQGLPQDLHDKHVLIIDDILDSGRTIRRIQALVSERNPLTMHTCVLLRKKLPVAMQTPVSYVGFEIEDEFVVGYGLDFDGYYRNLPDIGVPKANLLEPKTP